MQEILNDILNAKPADAPDRTPPPEGSYKAKLVDVKTVLGGPNDKGQKLSNSVKVEYVILEEGPHKNKRVYDNIFADNTNRIAKLFTEGAPAEFTAERFDLPDWGSKRLGSFDKLIDKEFVITIFHKESKGKVYANVKSFKAAA
jgi:hypothetical protein